MTKKKGKNFTIFSECCPDLDGGEVLEKSLELEGGELRLPLAARLLLQSVQQTGKH